MTDKDEEAGKAVHLAHETHRRVRRCSCENQKDKECIFFCHIGIVWVNTARSVRLFHSKTNLPPPDFQSGKKNSRFP